VANYRRTPRIASPASPVSSQEWAPSSHRRRGRRARARTFGLSHHMELVVHAAGRIASLTLLSLILSTPSHAQGGGAAAGCPRRGTATAEDCEAVRRAAFDYIEGFYEGDSTKLVRSIRPEVFKYGFWRPRDSTSFKGETMTWAEILKVARDV
jgi:hypothetical protein